MYHVDAGLCGRITFSGPGDWAKRQPSLTYGHPLVSEDAGDDRVDCDFTAFVGATAFATIDVSARAFPSAAQGRPATRRSPRPCPSCARADRPHR